MTATRRIGALLWCAALHFGTANAQVPRIDSIAPAQGPASGGTAVTITGAGFAPGTSVTDGIRAALKALAKS